MILAQQASPWCGSFISTVIGVPTLFTAISSESPATRLTCWILTPSLVLLGAAVWYFGPWAFGHFPVQMQTTLAKCRPLAFRPSQIVHVFLLIFAIRSEEDFHVNGPFGKAHLKSEIPSPFNCNRSVGIVSYLIRSISTEITDLNVSSTHYSNSDEIYVFWIPSLNPCADDFIGVYFVEVPVETGACDYVDYEFVKSGQDNSTWLMINLRRQLEFRYYSRERNCSGNYTFIAKSPIVEPVNYNEPTQIHLAFGDRNDQMYVSYVTNSNQTIPQCQYGPQAFINPGYMHTILLNDLHPSTIYFYRVGDNEHGWSSIHKFINRPSSIDDEINLIAYADMGVSPIQSGAKATIDRVLARVPSNNVTVILHIGDISYASGIGALWDAL
ncbi:unnamed protein product [Rotaria socialis]|uniref:Purple acid phosphatase N-terminal domain-containing protein n=1 Tax=Rotaria socialis TaxID=392032 RepID=A0A817S206_9BILA|nr:unnamed protein product [Rotaria socialis]CAF3603644.1 unnamed protein product [Rotaria socialis]